jgi:hypothetical protein
MRGSLRRCTKIPLQAATVESANEKGAAPVRRRPPRASAVLGDLPTASCPLTTHQFHRIVRLLLIPVTSSELLSVRLYRLPMLYPTDG